MLKKFLLYFGLFMSLAYASAGFLFLFSAFAKDWEPAFRYAAAIVFWAYGIFRIIRSIKKFKLREHTNDMEQEG